MYLATVIGFAALLMGVHLWAARAYLGFMRQHPEVEKQLAERGQTLSY